MGFFEGEAGFDAGAGVAGVGEPGGGKVALAGLVEFHEVGGELGEGLVEETLVDGAGHDAVAEGVDVDAVVGEGVVGLAFASRGHVVVDGGVDVDDVGHLGFEREDPLGVAGDDVAVIVLVNVAPGEDGCAEIDGVLFGAGGLDVEGRRGDEDELGTAGFDFFDEALDAFLVGDEAVVGEGVVDAIVHAVAGDDEVGFGFGEGAVEALGDVGSWEGVAGFGESGDALGAEADGDDFGSVSLKVKGGLQVGDEVAGIGDGVAEEDDAVGGEDRVGGLFDFPDFFEDGDEFGVMLEELGTTVRVEVVLVKVGFGSFGEVFHLVGHGVGFAVGNTVGFRGIAGTFDEVLVGAGFFGSVKGGEDVGVVVAEKVVVVGMGKFVEDEVGHAAGFLFEVVDAGELNGFGEFDRKVVVVQPSGAGVMAGAALAIRRGGEEEGDFFERGDGGCGDSVDDGLELLIDELKGAFQLFGIEVFVEEEAPAEVFLDGVASGRGEVGVAGDAEVGGEDIAKLGEGTRLVGVEGGEEIGGGDGLVGFEGGFGVEAKLQCGVVWQAAFQEGDGRFTFRFWAYFFFSF